LPDIIEIQPCTEEGLVTLEAKLGGKEEREFFDPLLLCRYINATPAFTKQRCSTEMGYGVAERLGRNVHAFKTGKIIVRRAEGREQALENLHLVSRSLWPALRVAGGDALVVCLGSEDGCASFPAPPAEGLELAPARPLSEAVREGRAMPRWKQVEEGIGLLRGIVKAYPQSGVSKATKEQFRKAEGPIIGFIVETEDVKKAAIGIPFLSASLFLDRGMQSCEKLDAGARPAAWALTAEAFEAAIEGSTERAAALRERLAATVSGAGAEEPFTRSLLSLAGLKLP
jgi:hypothetical protein